MDKLYEIKNEYLKVLSNVRIDEETGEMVGFDELDELKEDFTEKAKNVGLYILELDAEEAAIKDIIGKYEERKKAVMRRREWFKTYLTENMEQVGMDKLETPEVRISFHSSEAVEIKDAFMVPKEYLRIKTTEEPDKTAIKKAIKSGKTFDFATLVRKTSLQVK